MKNETQMKKPMKKPIKKLILFGAALLLALLFCASLALSASADEMEEPTVRIDAVSLGLEDRVCLLFRASVNGLEAYLEENSQFDDYDIELHFRTTPPVGNSYTGSTHSYRQDEENGFYYFSYNGQKPMQMTESVYAQVELCLIGAASNDDESIYSDWVRYSVLDYAHDAKNSTMTITEGGSTLGEMVQTILEYGAMSQTYFGYKTDRLPTDEYYLARVEGGNFSDGVKTAIVFPGDAVTFTLGDVPAGSYFEGWEDENGQFLSSSMTVTVYPTADAVYRPAFGVEEGISVGLAFEDIDDETCALIAKANCTDSDLVIPNHAPNGKLVTKINAGALAGITSVRIPASVTTIESDAFDGCTNLTTISVEEGNSIFTASDFLFLSVEGGTFSGPLSKILFAGESTYLSADDPPENGFFDHWEDASGTFVSDASVTIVTPTANTTYIAVFWLEEGVSRELAYTGLNETTCALSGMGSCTDTALVIPNRAPSKKWVTKINAGALAGHTTITSVRIPASVTTIESGAFDGCTNLTTITVEAGNSIFTASDFLFLSVEGGTFSGGLSEKILLAGESVSITAGEDPSGGAFNHWEDGNGQFVSDEPTTSVSPTANTTYIAVFDLPDEEVSLGLACEDIDGETCALSGMGACTDADLVIPNRSPDGKLVTKINSDALAGNTSLTSIRIPASVTTIENRAFDGCTALTAFAVQAGNSSFMTDRDMLLTADGTTILRYPPARAGTALALPSDTLELADGSFADATSLSTITMNESIERIGAYAFARSGISSVKIKATVTEIGEYAFDHCSKLTSVSVESGNTVYKASTYAIYTIDNTTLIRAKNYSAIASFLSGVTTFAPGSFSGCDKMTTITLPTSLKTIGEYAFADCTSLRAPALKSVESIEAYAFYGCSASTFSSITIPASVDNIGDSAFENCTNLTTVTLNGEISHVGVNVLRGTAVEFDPFGHVHSFTNYVKYSDASCSSGTVYTYECVCGLQSDERIVTSSAMAHTYSGSICSVCGQERMNTSYDSYLLLPKTGVTYHGTYDPSNSDYSSIDDTNLFYYENADEGDYNIYLQDLRNAGLTAGETYTLGANRYAFFRHSTYTLYASYLNTEQAIRVYVGKPNDVYPSKTPVADAGLVTPSIWQININNKAAASNGGMSYVIQLTDGKFLVVDGGYETAEDAKSIYDILKANKPSSHSKPIVAGWFLTHMHIDHVGAFRKFADTYSYRSGVTIEAFYYNFSYQNVDDVWPSNSQTWENKMSSRFPSATRYRKLHSGMNFYFSGAEVKILCTQEDVYPLAFNSGNDTSMVFQVIIGGQKILFLGDAEYGESDTMLNLGASVMKSDILQYAHHGYDYQCRAILYALIEPTTVLWPMPLVNYQSTSYGECFRPRYLNKSENAWIRSATCVKKIIVMEEGTTRLMLPYTPTGARNADYVTLYNNIKKTLS